jgi:hypothetical protein
LRNALPPLDSQESVSDPIVYARFQRRDTNWIWYVTEGSPQDDEAEFFVTACIQSFFLTEELA